MGAFVFVDRRGGGTYLLNQEASGVSEGLERAGGGARGGNGRLSAAADAGNALRRPLSTPTSTHPCPLKGGRRVLSVDGSLCVPHSRRAGIRGGLGGAGGHEDAGVPRVPRGLPLAPGQPQGARGRPRRRLQGHQETRGPVRRPHRRRPQSPPILPPPVLVLILNAKGDLQSCPRSSGPSRRA